jgi:hypothetical protein
MIAWLNAQAAAPRRRGMTCSAISHTLFSAPVFGRRGANTRRSTRATLVSTAAAGRSKAKLATAPAV